MNSDDADQMFNSFLGRAGGRRTEGNKNSLVNWDPTIFDDKDTVDDFTNQLLPHQQGGVSTQPQAAANLLVPPRRAAGAAAAVAVAAVAVPPIGIVPQVQPPPPPQQWGGGTWEARHWGAQITPASRRPCRGWGTGCMTRPPLTLSSGYRAWWFRGTPSRTGFLNFVANVQQLWVYLAMLGGQAHVTMIHTLGIYYSIKLLMSAYQGER
jgi:hypothetical protein